MPIDKAALKAEITNDPQHLGYASMTDEQAAAALNAPGRAVNREAIDGGLLVSCIDRAEFAALAANDKEYVRLLAATATPIPISAALRNDLGLIFPNPSKTRTALVAAVKRAGTRAEEINLGGAPTASDVADAKRS